MLEGREVEIDDVSGELVYHMDAFRGRKKLQQRREVKEVGNGTDGGWRIRAIRGACVILGSSTQRDGFDFQAARG